jgi:hypothetical protein
VCPPILVPFWREAAGEDFPQLKNHGSPFSPTRLTGLNII